MVISITIKFSFRHNEVFRELYFFCFLSLSSIQIICNVTRISTKRIFTKTQLSFWSKFFHWSRHSFLIIIISICALTIKFILRKNKILMNHFIFALRLKVIIFWIVSIIGAMKITFFHRVWTFMLSFIIIILYHNCRLSKCIYH